MKTRQWVALAIWFVCYTATLQFFRFKFGLFQISAAYMIIGILYNWIFRGWLKGRPNEKLPPGAA
jgi:hypothetical protein